VIQYYNSLSRKTYDMFFKNRTRFALKAFQTLTGDTASVSYYSDYRPSVFRQALLNNTTHTCFPGTLQLGVDEFYSYSTNCRDLYHYTVSQK
jgi:hypothetical protein